MKQIDSLQNPFIKSLWQLREKQKIRTEKQLFLIEGFKEILLAIKGGYSIEKVLVQKDIFQKKETLKALIPQVNFISVSEKIYQKFALRSNTEGVIAISKHKNRIIENYQLKKDNPLILVIESVEKPGNIGAILRTADASGIDMIFIANPKTDIYNPHIIRNSLGCVFTLPIFIGNNEQIIYFLKQKNIQIFATSLDNSSQDYQTQNYRQGTAIVVGTEATGLSKKWLNVADKKIIIPMRGVINSMNVSVVSAIVIFEAIRQRN